MAITIAGLPANVVNNSIRLDWVPKMNWQKLSNGNWNPFDIGDEYDRFYCEFDVRGTRAEMETMHEYLNTYGRGMIGISYTQDTGLFGPSTHDAVTSVSIERYPELRRVGFRQWGLDGFRLLALDGGWPTTTPDYDVMRLSKNAYVSNTTIDAAALASLDLSAVTLEDQRVDIGVFRASMIGTDDEFAALFAALYDGRGEAIAFPDIQGITYPFGPRGPSDGGQCRVKSISNIRRSDLNWEYDIEIVQEYT